MNIDPNTIQNVGLVSGPEFNHVIAAVAKLLKKNIGCNVHIYANSPQEAKTFRNLDTENEFATINEVRLPMQAATENKPLDAAKVTANANAWEKRLGETINQILMTNRHLGRGYSLGGFNHPRSRSSENASYLQAVYGITECLDYWDREIKEKKLELLINLSKESSCVARYNNVPVRRPTLSKYKGYHYWAVNEFCEYPAFNDTYEKLRANGSGAVEQVVDLEKEYGAARALRKKAVKKSGLPGLMRKIVYQCVRQAYWIARGYEKAKGYYLSENIKYLIRQYSGQRKMTKVAATTLEDLEGTPFFFFPLHLEPEIALTQFSPEYFSQLAAIASLSRDLPAGVKLAVKEQIFSLGARPDNFYEQLLDFKNVVLLDMNELGVNVARKAKAVTVITGSTGFEAAVMGTPVISFGRHNIYNIVPHVHLVTREEDLKGAIDEIMTDDVRSEAKQRDGRLFLQAIIDNSFDLFDYDYVQRDKFDPKSVEDACEKLMESLRTNPV